VGTSEEGFRALSAGRGFTPPLRPWGRREALPFFTLAAWGAGGCACGRSKGFPLAPAPFGVRCAWASLFRLPCGGQGGAPAGAAGSFPLAPAPFGVSQTCGGARRGALEVQESRPARPCVAAPTDKPVLLRATLRAPPCGMLATRGKLRSWFMIQTGRGRWLYRYAGDTGERNGLVILHTG